MDPDPGGPKTCGSGGSGSATLLLTEGHLTDDLTVINRWAYDRRSPISIIDKHLTEDFIVISKVGT
jgi:hypothetical protein